jgi:hypothetical protein
MTTNMIRRTISAACLTAVLGFGAPSFAQLGDLGKATVKTTEKAGKATADAGKKVGSGVKEGTTTVATETKNAVTSVPKDATGKCHDGTYTTAKTRSGACSKHGGVDKWF